MPKLIKLHGTKSDHNRNHGLCLIKMCQQRFINCNKCASLTQDIADGETVGGGGGCTGVSSYLLLNFSVNITVF